MIIRRAIFEDASSIAQCLFLAMEDIVIGLSGEKNTEKAIQFLQFFVEKEYSQYSYKNCWIAEINGTVAGAINVYDGAELTQLRQPIIDYIANLRRHIVNIEDETTEGELYVDSIGILPMYQGMGIGSKLLQRIIDEFVIRQKRTIGLLVDAENPGARKLYLKLGFTSKGQKMFAGKHMEHLQLKP